MDDELLIQYFSKYKYLDTFIEKLFEIFMKVKMSKFKRVNIKLYILA